jgi:hypothetical protein
VISIDWVQIIWWIFPIAGLVISVNYNSKLRGKSQLDPASIDNASKWIVATWLISVLLGWAIVPEQYVYNSKNAHITALVLKWTMLFGFAYIFAFCATWALFRVFRKGSPTPAIAILSIQPTALLIALLIFTGWYAGMRNPTPDNDNAVSKSETPLAEAETNEFSETAKLSKVFVADTVQDAEGTTPADMTVEFLSNLEAYLVLEIRKKAKNRLSELGYDPDDIDADYTSSSVYMDVDGKRLGVIKFWSGGPRSVFVVGFVGKDFHRVTCLRKEDIDIPIMTGKCGNKIMSVFGIKFPSSN